MAIKSTILNFWLCPFAWDLQPCTVWRWFHQNPQKQHIKKIRQGGQNLPPPPASPRNNSLDVIGLSSYLLSLLTSVFLVILWTSLLSFLALLCEFSLLFIKENYELCFFVDFLLLLIVSVWTIVSFELCAFSVT